jgi:hypothetical protein
MIERACGEDGCIQLLTVMTRLPALRTTSTGIGGAGDVFKAFSNVRPGKASLLS